MPAVLRISLFVRCFIFISFDSPSSVNRKRFVRFFWKFDIRGRWYVFRHWSENRNLRIWNNACVFGLPEALSVCVCVFFLFCCNCLRSSFSKKIRVQFSFRFKTLEKWLDDSLRCRKLLICFYVIIRGAWNHFELRARRVLDLRHVEIKVAEKRESRTARICFEFSFLILASRLLSLVCSNLPKFVKPKKFSR